VSHAEGSAGEFAAEGQGMGQEMVDVFFGLGAGVQVLDLPGEIVSAERGQRRLKVIGPADDTFIPGQFEFLPEGSR